MAGAAVAVRGGRLDVALGVLGGGLLVGVSYWGVKSGIDGVLALMGSAADAEAAGRKRRTPLAVIARIVIRYGLIGGVAYLLVAVLGLNPIGLLLGASSSVAAAALEAGRVLTGPRRS